MMGWLNNLFYTSDEERFKQGLKAANEGKSEVAIQTYDSILASTPDADLRARCLFNRALAFWSLGDQMQTENDLKRVLTVQNSSEVLQSAAREKLDRIQKMVER